MQRRDFKLSNARSVALTLFAATLLFGSTACRYFKKKRDDANLNPVARVYDKFLYAADLKGIGTHAATPEDSLQAVKNYIDSWIREELVLRYAQDNLPEDMTDVDKQVDKYRRSLIVYTYERALVADKLDTAVSANDIQTYYDKYREAFTLRTPLFNVKYACLKHAPKQKIDSAKVWMQHANYANNSKLRNFCREYAVRFEAGDSSWFTQEDLQKLVPLETVDWESIGYSRGFTETFDSSYQYLVKVNGYKIKGSDAPLPYVRRNIYNIIVNQRKLDYVTQVHNAIYNDALKNKKFEIYNEP